jgi:hypothetical protein
LCAHVGADRHFKALDRSRSTYDSSVNVLTLRIDSSDTRRDRKTVVYRGRGVNKGKPWCIVVADDDGPEYVPSMSGTQKIGAIDYLVERGMVGRATAVGE